MANPQEAEPKAASEAPSEAQTPQAHAARREPPSTPVRRRIKAEEEERQRMQLREELERAVRGLGAGGGGRGSPLAGLPWAPWAGTWPRCGPLGRPSWMCCCRGR